MYVYVCVYLYYLLPSVSKHIHYAFAIINNSLVNILVILYFGDRYIELC